jgi:hypothetical protein
MAKVHDLWQERVYRKTMKVLTSCKSFYQIRNARNYLVLAWPHMSKSQRHITGQLFLEMSLRLQGAI